MTKDGFLADRRTLQAVIMNLVIIGEAVTKAMDRYAGFAETGARRLTDACRDYSASFQSEWQVQVGLTVLSQHTILPARQPQMPLLPLQQSV